MKIFFFLLLILVGKVQAETIVNVFNNELPEPVMLGRYDDFNHSEVLVAAIPQGAGLSLWVIVQSKSNYSVSWDFPLGTISSLDSVNPLGDGIYEIVVGVNGVPESQLISLDARKALIEMSRAAFSRDGGRTRTSISVEREALATSEDESSTEE